jgi:hypothetical protein
MVAIATLPPPILMLATWAIIIPILVGFFIPILSNIIPIRVEIFQYFKSFHRELCQKH